MLSNASGKTIPTLDRAFDLYEAGDSAGAVDACKYLLDREDDNYGALYLLGSIYGKEKHFNDSIVYLNKAIEINPTKPIAYYNLANALHLSDRPLEALAAIDFYISKIPNNPEAHIVRAEILSKLHRFEESLRSSERAIEISPDFAEAYNIRGNALANLRRLDEALASYGKAVALKPDYAEAYNNRGNALRELNRLDEALDDYRKAVAAKPSYSEAYENQGNVFALRKRYESAISCYESAIALAPDSEFLVGRLYYARQNICAWATYDEDTESLKERIRRLERVAEPFPILSIADSNLLNRQASQIWIKAKIETSSRPQPFERRSKGQKIRIGYFSADFRNHATAHLMAEVFERHDKSKFEVIAFSFGPDARDAMRARLVAAFDKFIELGDKSDQEIVDLARRFEIDIAIDLKGFTDDNRFEIFVRRAAPIQVSYLGFPGAIGAECIDYVIADKVVIAERREAEFAEKVVRLPDSYFPTSYRSYGADRQTADKQHARASYSLPERGCVFCCFNNNYKITPDVFDGWMRILKRTPDSVLWLLGDNAAAVENLRKEAERRAVDPARLVFAARAPLAEHLARHRLADLFLDTLPYNAHTTASDALWAGLPVLTRIGETFAGRVAASLLTAVGLPEMIATSQAEYEALAVELATNPEKLAATKQKLANNRLTTPLFDTERYTRNLEAAYLSMYERYHADLPPDHIYVEP